MPNQSLEPTPLAAVLKAEGQFMKDEVKAKLVAASGDSAPSR
jgi:hypothetical protein